MKKKSVLLAAIFAGVLAVAAPAARARADVAVSFSFFHQNLSPYGQWVSVGSYGQCWAPAGVQAGWQPYTVGHWIYTDYGWTWVSSDPWGDVTYRYGTWTFAPAYGWVWVPGFVWAPSWVTWSYTDDYVGWAPIPPTFSLSVSGYVGAPVVVSRTAYVFVPTNHFVNADVARVRVPVQDNSVILARSQKVTRFPVSGGIVRNQGPEPARIERVAKVSIPRAGTSEVGIAPVRVDAVHRSGNRIAVVAPASAKKTEGRAVSATEKSSSGTRSTHSEAARPPASRESQPKAAHEAHPSREKERSVKEHPVKVDEKPSHGTAARPPETRESAPAREKARPESGQAPATHQARAEEHARPNEKPAPKESARPESARPSEPHGAPQNEKRAQPKKPPAKPHPEKADKGEKPS
jgi:hypothetical protein